MTLKQALWEIVRDENIIITNQNIDWLLDRASKKATGDAQALKESILERKGVIEENIPTTLTNEEKISVKVKQIEEMADKLYYNTPILEEETCNIVAEYLYNTGWVQLPCKVGDTLYVISQMKDKRILPFINEYEVTSIEIKRKSIVIYHEMDGYIKIFRETNFGKTVFLSKEEAERVVTDIYDGCK